MEALPERTGRLLCFHPGGLLPIPDRPLLAPGQRESRLPAAAPLLCPLGQTQVSPGPSQLPAVRSRPGRPQGQARPGARESSIYCLVSMATRRAPSAPPVTGPAARPPPGAVTSAAASVLPIFGAAGESPGEEAGSRPPASPRRAPRSRPRPRGVPAAAACPAPPAPPPPPLLPADPRCGGRGTRALGTPGEGVADGTRSEVRRRPGLGRLHTKTEGCVGRRGWVGSHPDVLARRRKSWKQPSLA